tara:strand:- start:318 stop:1235 length:918 start_codon:yes stop_codon:yes gene_type:complete
MEDENKPKNKDINSVKPPSIVIYKKETNTNIKEENKINNPYEFFIGIFTPIIIFTFMFALIDNLQDNYYEWDDEHGDLNDDYSINFRTDANNNGIYLLNFNDFKEDVTGISLYEKEQINTENLELEYFYFFPVMNFYNFNYNNPEACFLDKEELICNYNFSILVENSSESHDIYFDEERTKKILLYSYNLTTGKEDLQNNITVGEFSPDNQTLWLDLGVLKYDNGENLTFFPALSGRINVKEPPEPFEPPEFDIFCCLFVLCFIFSIYLCFIFEKRWLGWGLLSSIILGLFIGGMLINIFEDLFF